MLHLYSNKDYIPNNIKYIKDNYEYFMKVTKSKLDERVNGLLRNTDMAVFIDKSNFSDKFGRTVSWRDLSMGGKTILNIFYNEDCCFDTLECGLNALTDLKNLTQGSAYPDVIFNLDNKDTIDIILDDDEDYYYYSYRDMEE